VTVLQKIHINVLAFSVSNSSPLKKKHVMKCHEGCQAWMNSLGTLCKLRKLEMKSGTWNIRSMFTRDSCERTIKIKVRFTESTGQMGQGGTKPAGE
jgi:hypothetical protein